MVHTRGLVEVDLLGSAQRPDAVVHALAHLLRAALLSAPNAPGPRATRYARAIDGELPVLDHCALAAMSDSWPRGRQRSRTDLDGQERPVGVDRVSFVKPREELEVRRRALAAVKLGCRARSDRAGYISHATRTAVQHHLHAGRKAVDPGLDRCHVRSQQSGESRGAAHSPAKHSSSVFGTTCNLVDVRPGL
jgi:hypothetical protein